MTWQQKDKTWKPRTRAGALHGVNYKDVGEQY